MRKGLSNRFFRVRAHATPRPGPANAQGTALFRTLRSLTVRYGTVFGKGLQANR